MQKVKAIIHLDNIRKNAERFSAWTGTKLCAVVKADAYGHGAVQIGRLVNVAIGLLLLQRFRSLGQIIPTIGIPLIQPRDDLFDLNVIFQLQ